MRIALLFACFLCYNGLFAQLPGYVVALGGRQGVAKLPSGVRVLYEENHEICVIKSREMSAAIERPWMLSWYDQKSLYKIDSLTLDIHENGKKCLVDQLVKVNDRIFVIYSLIGERHRKVSVFARQLYPAERSISDVSRKLFEFTAAKHQSVRPGRVEFATSPDRSKIFFMRGFSRDSLNKEVAFFAMLDTGLNEQWSKTMRLPYPADLMKIQNLKLSDQGDAYALIVLRAANQVIPTFDVLITRHEGRSVRRYPLQSKNGFASSAQIELTEGRLVCAGFYSKTGDVGARGVFFNTIDTESLLHSEFASDFDSKFVLQDMHRRDFTTMQSKADMDFTAELSQFFIDHVVPDQDGGFILIGEQRYDYSIAIEYLRPRGSLPRGYNYRMGRNLYQPSRFYRGDIIAIKVDEHGVIEWQSKIHKSQDTNDNRSIFSSYMVLDIGGKLRLLFNEDRRNITGFALRKEKDFGGSTPIIAIVTLSDSGEPVRELIYDSAEWPIVMSPSMSTQVSESEVLLYGNKFHREQFSRIKFK